jgi:hypothetical protein
MINGPVSYDQVDSYYRYDATVKVGAIIRNTDGTFPYRGTVAGRPFSILTVDQALVKLNIPATYSIVSIYTNDGYLINDLSRIISLYSHEVPFMVMQDWQSEIQKYKMFNLMIYIFVSALSAFLILTATMILMTQLMIKTQLGMKRNALMRINGLSFIRLLRIWASQIIIILFAGCLSGIPISLTIIQIFGVQARFNILNQILYYFPAINLAYIFLLIFVITIGSCIPSIIYMNKYKNNILFDI